MQQLSWLGSDVLFWPNWDLSVLCWLSQQIPALLIEPNQDASESVCLNAPHKRSHKVRISSAYKVKYYICIDMKIWLAWRSFALLMVLEKGPKAFKLQLGERTEVVSPDRMNPHAGQAPLAAAEPPRRGRWSRSSWGLRRSPGSSMTGTWKSPYMH